MIFELGPELRADQRLAALVEMTRGVLADILGGSAASVEARWSLAHDDRGRPLLILKLSDFGGPPQEAPFAPAELESLPHLRDRFRRIWGDLLQWRAEGIVGRLKSIVGTEP